MKYRLAKDFGVFEKGTEFREFEISIGALSFGVQLLLDKLCIEDYLEQGIIESVPELEFTKEDMIDFANFWGDTDINETDFQQWQEQRK